MRLLSDLVDSTRYRTGELDPSAVALTDGATALTWRQYVDRVARMASVVRQAGVRPGDRVGVRLPKSCDSFVAVHAVIRAGAVMVPLDANAPASVTASVVADAGVSVLIDNRRTTADAAEIDGIRTLILPGTTERPAEATAGPAVFDEIDIESASPAPAADGDPDAPVYIIYTSGSTGRPKGIVHSHASALAYAANAAAEYTLGPDDRLANIAPLHFDQSTFELYAAPLVGATVIVVPDPVLRFPASVTELIARERATVWYSVPYLLEQIGARGVLEDRDLTSLRWVIFGGETFPHLALADLVHRLPTASFSNVYGPAEVNQCTAYRIDEPPDGPVPIGRAWRGADIRLVEPHDPATDVPDGTPGVVAVTSPTMMLGYWNRPDLTASATFVDEADVKWYVTGDLARRDEHGDLMFVGRVDNQIKLRGHRIELEAVDSALRSAAGVNAATVVVERPPDGDDRLVAFVEIDGCGRPDVESAVTATLREQLPRYAVPSEVRVVASLPRTSTGKIDRIAATELLGDHPATRPTTHPSDPTVMSFPGASGPARYRTEVSS